MFFLVILPQIPKFTYACMFIYNVTIYPPAWLKLENKKIPSVGENVEQQECSHSASGNITGLATSVNCLAGFAEDKHMYNL